MRTTRITEAFLVLFAGTILLFLLKHHLLIGCAILALVCVLVLVVDSYLGPSRGKRDRVMETTSRLDPRTGNDIPSEDMGDDEVVEPDLQGSASTNHESEVVFSFRSTIDEMYHLGPNSWLGQIGNERPELTFRIALAMPARPASRLDGESATKVRGEARESLIQGFLESSSTTKWLGSLYEDFHLEASPSWHVYGSGNPEFTQFLYSPDLAQDLPRPTLTARLAILTGWRALTDGSFVPAVQASCDLMLNILELDSERRASQIRHQSDTPPAPAALSLRETACYLVELLRIQEFISSLAERLLGVDELSSGYVGAWLDISGVEMRRVLRLSNIRRVDRASESAGHVIVRDWHMSEGADNSESKLLVATFMDQMLEVSGYRGIEHEFDWLRV